MKSDKDIREGPMALYITRIVVWLKYYPKLRLMWLGLIFIALLNLVVVLNEDHGMDSKDSTTDATERLVTFRRQKKDVHISLISDSVLTMSNGSNTISDKYKSAPGLVSSEYIQSKLPPDKTEREQETSIGRLKSISDTENAEGPKTPKGSERPDSCQGCFRSSFSYSGGEHVCRSIRDGSPEQVDIFIAITTSYTHMRERTTLRKTWLTRTKQNTAKVRYAFFLGETNNNQLKKYVAKESELHHDVVVIDFLDTYHNLTYKTMAAFRWIKTWCGQTKYILKTDDDMYINIGNLIGLTNRFRGLLQTRIMGSCKRQSPVREQNSHYYVSEEFYPQAEYPTVCSGTGYVTSIKVIERILNISPNVPYFPLEDVYVALCLSKLGLGTRRFQGFLSSVPSNAPLCIFKGRIVVTGHIRSSRIIEEIWNSECGSRVERQ